MRWHSLQYLSSEVLQSYFICTLNLFRISNDKYVTNLFGTKGFDTILSCRNPRHGWLRELPMFTPSKVTGHRQEARLLQAYYRPSVSAAAVQ